MNSASEVKEELENLLLDLTVDKAHFASNLSGEIGSRLLELVKKVQQRDELVNNDEDVWLNALDSIPDPIFIHDAEYRIIRANRSYRDKTGLGLQEIIGKVYWRIFPNLDAPPEGCRVSLALKEGRSEEIKLPSGEVYLTHYRPILDKKGDYHYSLHIMEDVTEVSLIREEQRKLSLALEQLSESVLILDVGGEIRYANRAFYNLFGYSEAEILGRKIEMLNVSEQEDFKQPIQILNKLRKHGSTKQKVLRLAKDNTQIPVLLTASSFYDTKGMLVGYVGSYFDLREIEETKSNNILLKKLINYSTDAIEVVDPITYAILDVNKAACDTLGYSREEMLLMSVHDIDPDVDADLEKKVAESLQKHGEITFESRHQRKDGSIFPVEVSLKQAQIDKKIYVISIVRDITERKAREKLLLQSTRAQQALSACNAALIHAVDENLLLEGVCRSIVDGSKYALAWISYSLCESDGLSSVVACADSTVRSLELDKSSYPCAMLQKCESCVPGLLEKISFLTKDIKDESECSAWRDYARQNGLGSHIRLPLIDVEGKTFGHLNISSKDQDVFSDEETLLLENLAGDLSYGIISLRTKKERDHYQLQHLKSVEELKSSLISTVQAIGTTAEKRDPYTAGHQTRVALLSVAIANKLGLDMDVIEGLKLGASIHDIGKIYVPSEILTRPGRLTHAEFEIIKSHPEVGYDIIKDIKFPWPVAEMVLQHHERMDGSGYPKGLRGDEIILESRIVAVADVIEAIAAHRPYRAGHGIDIALDEIEKNKGQLYDVRVADACLDLFKKDGYQLSNNEMEIPPIQNYGDDVIR